MPLYMYFLLFILGCAAAALAWVYILFYLDNRKYNKYRMPPTDLWSGYGKKLAAAGNILLEFRRLEMVFGGIFRIRIGPTNFLMISDVKYAEKILAGQSDTSSFNHILGSWLGDSLSRSSGLKWAKMRAITKPGFHQPLLSRSLEVFNEKSHMLAEKFDQVGGASLDVSSLVSLFCFDVICESAIGIEMDTLKDKMYEYHVHTKIVTNIITERLFSAAKQYDALYDSTKQSELEQASIEYLHGFARDLVRKRKEMLPKKDRLLIDALLDAEELSEDDIVEEVNSFLFAGHAKMASAVSFALFNISQHPQVQEKLVGELKEIFGEDQYRPVTNEDVAKMQYADMVIKESMRLHPPAPLYPRKTLSKMKLFIFDDEKTLHPNTNVFINVYNLNRSRAYKECEKFIPERFHPQAANNPEHHYSPFGFGNRSCIGERFAMLQLKVVLANILRRFEIVPEPKHKIVPLFRITLQSENGIPMRFKRRTF